MMTPLYSLQNNPEGTKNTLRLTYTAYLTTYLIVTVKYTIIIHQYANTLIQWYWYLKVESSAYGTTKFFVFVSELCIFFAFVCVP